MARSLLEHSEYDAVITDLDLECAGAGLEIAKFAKSRRPFPVVFVYTDAPTPAALREMFKIPVDYCAIAPFSASEIGSALSRLIARRDAVEAVSV
jgi:DNA-binding NtrC family response regulator